MPHEPNEGEMEVIKHAIGVGVRSGPGRKNDLDRLSGAIIVTAVTWDDLRSHFRIHMLIDTIGYVDQADFQLLAFDNALAYSTAMCREAKSGGYAAHYHYVDALMSGVPTLPVVGQLAGESIAQLFYGPESTDSVFFQQ